MELAVKPEERIALIRVLTAARRLGVTRQTIYNLISFNRIGSLEIDGLTFVDSADVERLRLERAAVRQTA